MAIYRHCGAAGGPHAPLRTATSAGAARGSSALHAPLLLYSLDERGCVRLAAFGRAGISEDPEAENGDGDGEYECPRG